jgi:hypothetical protein
MFRGWRVFLNSPTLAPRGSGLTPTIRFHKYFGNLEKNVTLGTSEGTHVTREPYNGLIEAGFAELPPLTPINRRLPLLNFFTVLLFLSRIVTLPLRESRLVLRSSRPSSFLRTSVRYYSFCSLALFHSFYCIRFFILQTSFAKVVLISSSL